MESTASEEEDDPTSSRSGSNVDSRGRPPGRVGVGLAGSGQPSPWLALPNEQLQTWFTVGLTVRSHG